jgi:adhesin transport system membrane fusion protein
VEHTQLRAPQDGIVNLITQTTVGAVLRPGDEIMQLLPTGDDLIIECRLKASDIGFVRPGMQATIKLDAFDYSIYGSLQGEVTYISPDALTERSPQGVEVPYYRTHIRISGHRFKGQLADTIKVQPGMTATAEIITGKHTVLDYLLKPVKKTLSESMGER